MEQEVSDINGNEDQGERVGDGGKIQGERGKDGGKNDDNFGAVMEMIGRGGHHVPLNSTHHTHLPSNPYFQPHDVQWPLHHILTKTLLPNYY